MKPPSRDFYEDDPDGYEAAWSRFEDMADMERDRKRDEAMEAADSAHEKASREAAALEQWKVKNY